MNFTTICWYYIPLYAHANNFFLHSPFRYICCCIFFSIQFIRPLLRLFLRPTIMYAYVRTNARYQQWVTVICNIRKISRKKGKNELCFYLSVLRWISFFHLVSWCACMRFKFSLVPYMFCGSFSLFLCTQCSIHISTGSKPKMNLPLFST